MIGFKVFLKLFDSLGPILALEEALPEARRVWLFLNLAVLSFKIFKLFSKSNGSKA